MKIKVKLEGRKNIYIPDKRSLKSWLRLNKFKTIHNFVATGAMVIGADHEIDSVLKDIDKADRVALLLGEHYKQNFGHALALIINNKLEMYDVGQLTTDDLEVEGEK